MKRTWRAGLLLAALVLAGCDHHQPSSQAGAGPAPAGAGVLGAPIQPLDSMKQAPRAALVALPGRPIPPQALATAPASKPAPVAPPAPLPPDASSIAASPPPSPAAADTSNPTSAPDEVANPPATNSDTGAMSEANPPETSPAPGSAGPLPDETTSAAPGEVAAATPAPPSTPEQEEQEVPDNAEVAVIQTSYGKIVIAFDDFAAPKTCRNFRQLVADGFYNNTVFHRVIPDFIIQGGDPKSKSAAADRDTFGLGSPGYTLPPEIGLKHDRGAVGMARLPDYLNPKKESNGSQFYICLVPCPSLDDQYTVFGHVIQGLDVAEKIAQEPRDSRDNPLRRVEMTVTLEPKSQAVSSGPRAAANP